jgi:hypothetical protein
MLRIRGFRMNQLFELDPGRFLDRRYRAYRISLSNQGKPVVSFAEAEPIALSFSSIARLGWTTEEIRVCGTQQRLFDASTGP